MIEVLLLCAVAAAVVVILVALSAGLLITTGLIASLWVTTKAHSVWRTRPARRVEQKKTSGTIGRQWRLMDDSTMAAT